MTTAAATIDNMLRPLRSADLERIIAIDSAHVGEPRRRFFEKRLAHAKRHPDDFVHVGVVRKGALVGFAFARILRGEVASSGWSPLVVIQPSGSRPPLFCMHGAGGTVLIYVQ